jgi:hypothetical protein
MYRAFPLILLFLLTAGVTVKAQKLKDNDILTYETGDTGRSYKKLLITGFGTIPVRHFMENLSGLLIKHYNGRSVTGAYEYIGNKMAAFNQNVQVAVSKHQPDIALCIYEVPDNPDTLAMAGRSREYLRWLMYPGVKYQKAVHARKQKFKQNLQAVLWEPAENKIIWRGEIFVSGNAAWDLTFERISGLITGELARLNILTTLPVN